MPVTWGFSSQKSVQNSARAQIANGDSPVRIGRRQSMPSSSIESWARVSATVPLSAFGQMKPAALQPLREQTAAVTIEPNHLDQIATAPAENENMAGERILFQHGLHQRTNGSRWNDGLLRFFGNAHRQQPRGTRNRRTESSGAIQPTPLKPWLALTPCVRATRATEAPGASVSSTILRLISGLRCCRLLVGTALGEGTTSMTAGLEVPICARSGHDQNRSAHLRQSTHQPQGRPDAITVRLRWRLGRPCYIVRVGSGRSGAFHRGRYLRCPFPDWPVAAQLCH
jgi:hypothetical protein